MSVIEGNETTLILDIGSSSTRAILFDIVEGRYRFIAKGVAATTIAAPFNDISRGVIDALAHLQVITTHTYLDVNQQLIIPRQKDGGGVDSFAVCISVGKPLEVVVVGLLDNVSGESARRLAQSTYCEVKEMINLNDGRNSEERLNLLIQSRPDLIIAAGGTNSGASKSAIKLLETVELACYLLPETQRPEVLFAGNEMILDDLYAALEPFTIVHHAPNIRPHTDKENLEPARSVLEEIIVQKKIEKVKGLNLIHNWAGQAITPTAAGFGRITKFLSAVLKERKGVLGIDLGATAAVVAAAIQGELSINVIPQLGMTTEASILLELINPVEIIKWLPETISEKVVKEFVFDRWLFPGSLPGSEIECEIEGAVIRQILFQALKAAEPGIRKRFPEDFIKKPMFEPILLSGSVFSKSTDQKRNAFLALDGLQPEGITTLIIDQHQIAPALGAAAELNSLLTVQVLDSNAFLNLGTVIAPISHVKIGRPILRYKMIYENGLAVVDEVKHGSLETITLPYGINAELFLQPYYGTDIGMGAAGRSGKLIVKGGLFGVIIDARGRPLQLPQDPAERWDLSLGWQQKLGVQ